MWDVSETYKSLLIDEGHYFEYSIAFGNTTADNGYKEDDLVNVEAVYKSFSEERPSVGGCLSAELTVEMFTPLETIPRMAKVRPYVRVTNGAQTSEWVPQGVFWIDTRESSKNDDERDVTVFHAYDGMMKAETDYSGTSLNWPAADVDVVEEIAAKLGVGVDDRTWDVMTRGYGITLPAGFTLREVLSNIAAMYAGNWVMNYNGDLLLVALNSIPPETNYLISEISDSITFGEFVVGDGEETRILV